MQRVDASTRTQKWCCEMLSHSVLLAVLLAVLAAVAVRVVREPVPIELQKC
eukprot:m.358446 g.358446  ORF g.358446 m.358446 type:complete len:51 (+) comp18146_c0_seq1:194-346(+)